MRAAAVLGLLALVHPAASGAALVDETAGRALVAVGGAATVAGEVGAFARWGPPEREPGPWTALGDEALPAGPTGCLRGVCGILAVEVRGGEAWVVESGAGVLLRGGPATPAADGTSLARAASAKEEAAVPGPGTGGGLAALAAAARACVSLKSGTRHPRERWRACTEPRCGSN